MTHDDALAALADHPHAWRYRQLAEDDSDPERRDAYRVLVVRLATGEATGEAPAPRPVAVDYDNPPPAARSCCGGATP